MGALAFVGGLPLTVVAFGVSPQAYPNNLEKLANASRSNILLAMINWVQLNSS